MPTANKPLKESLGKEAVQRIARSIGAAHPEFPQPAFIRTAMRGLDGLELKMRVGHIIAALRRHLPRELPRAMETLASAGECWRPGRPDDPMGALAAWPVTDFIGEYGLDHFEPSMDAMRRLTHLFSAEFAIRPFIERYPRETLKTLHGWTADPSEHIRRLVSEGTRPRLPWGARLREFQRDPAPVLALLEKLVADPSEYVRRSVANNLNDISKDHPDLAAEVAARWAKGESAHLRKLIRHALRSLVKAGHPGALRVLGYDPQAKLAITGIKIAPAMLKLGDDLRISFDLVSRAKGPQPLVVDYAVHFTKRNGGRGGKVFKLKTLTLAPGESLPVEKIHKFRRITTRRHYSGKHAVEILVNGASHAQAEFDLIV